MAENVATASENTVVIEDVGPARKRLTITIPADVVSERLETSMATMMSEAQLPGFRPGRAPRRLIEKRFGKAIRDEAKNQLVASAYSEALEQHKIAAMGDPEPGEGFAEMQVEIGKPLTFSLEIEVPPEFELPSLEGIKITKPIIEVTEDMVDKQIDRMRMNEGSLESQEKGEPGYYCIGHGRMTTKDDKELLDLEGAVIQVPEKESDGSGAILGVLVKDFAKQVGTPKPGDSLTIKTKGPQNHEDERVRGEDLVISFDVERVERIVPAPIDHLVAQFGFADEQQFRETVTLRLNQQAVLEQQTAMRQQAMRHLIESVEMELPKRLTARQAAQTLERRRMELTYRGYDPQLIERHIAELRSSSEEAAVRELKLFFVLVRVAQALEIKISEEEVNGRIAQLAMSRGVRPEQLRNELIQTNQVQSVVQQVRDHKALDTVVDKAEITEMSLDEFNDKVADGTMVRQLSLVR